jgi:methyltransferase FkbM-like protein
VLPIDTEGFDYKVLAQIDLSRYVPRLILFEHKHLSAEEKTRAAALLRAYGYRCSELGGDTLVLR